MIIVKNHHKENAPLYLFMLAVIAFIIYMFLA